MDIERRNFLKGVACGGLMLATGVPAALAAEGPRKSLPPDAVGFLYDATLCIGCKACVSACKKYNDMPAEHSTKDQIYDNPIDLSSKTLNIIKLYQSGQGGEKDKENGFSFVKRQCMHCADPSCISACPVSALKKDQQTGIVTYNKDACIGCRYCQVACPYDIPKFEFDKAFPQIRKCQLCAHRMKEGKYAACAEFCPTGSTVYGKVSDLLEEAKRRLTLKAGEDAKFPIAKLGSAQINKRAAAQYIPHIFGEKEGGGTQILMLAAVPFDKLGLPDLPETSDASKSEHIQHTIYKGMIGPAALLAGLLAVAYKNTKDK